VSTIPLGEYVWKDQVTNVIYCGFPSITCPERISVYRQFSFHDRQKNKRRLLICAQILIAGKFIYLVEAERRLNDQGMDIETFPILALWSNGFTKIENNKFQWILAETVKNPSKTWPQDISTYGLMRGTIEHRRESKSSKGDPYLSDTQRKELKLKGAVDRIVNLVNSALELVG
jgi:hypothetical protein